MLEAGARESQDASSEREFEVKMLAVVDLQLVVVVGVKEPVSEGYIFV
jgi:hypothetical protein